jgi:hypothetical protein
MPIRSRLSIAAISCAVLAAGGAFVLLSGLNSRDVIHLYARSNTPDVYEIFETSGPNFAGQQSAANNYIPRVAKGGTVPVSFPVSSKVYQLRIDPGTQPVPVVIVQLCLERDLFVTHCVEGKYLAGYVDQAHEVALSADDGGLNVESKGGDPYFLLSPRLMAVLQPAADVPLFLVKCLIALAAAVFFFCFFYSWVAPLTGFWNLEATLTFMGAVAIRAYFFANYGRGTVSDSALFENYLHQHLFLMPGIRGILYPSFLALFPPRGTAVFLTQSLLGAVGAVMVLFLLRSMKRASRWDILFALAATSIPTLVVMEAIILSESLAAFLVLAALVAFRSLQLHGFRISVSAGLGAACAMLYHTKPQFGFTILLFAVTLLLAHRRSIGAIVAFGAPVLALQGLVIVINTSAGNFHGVTSTLGYSLFDHAQQLLTCPGSDPDPHIEYYCRARAALGASGNPTSYTAWVIYPAMHELRELFPEVTADYARLSFKLIAAHPVWYAGSAARSFYRFWVDDVPMVPAAIGRRNQNVVLPIDRFLRIGFEVSFFLSFAVLLSRRVRDDRNRLLCFLLTILIVLSSAAVQALAESGIEQARFAVPTMPLMLTAAIFAAGMTRPAEPWLSTPGRTEAVRSVR